MSRPLVLVDAEKDSDDRMANPHGYGSRKQNGFPSQLVNVKDGRDGGEEHCYAYYARSEEAGGVARGAQRCEYRRRIGENCIVES